MIKCEVQDCPGVLDICCRECEYYLECLSCEDIPTDCGESTQLDTEPSPTIKDSGNRSEFPTGAVRDLSHGKGRMDLLPMAME